MAVERGAPLIKPPFSQLPAALTFLHRGVPPGATAGEKYQYHVVHMCAECKCVPVTDDLKCVHLM